MSVTAYHIFNVISHIVHHFLHILQHFLQIFALFGSFLTYSWRNKEPTYAEFSRYFLVLEEKVAKTEKVYFSPKFRHYPRFSLSKISIPHTRKKSSYCPDEFGWRFLYMVAMLLKPREVFLRFLLITIMNSSVDMGRSWKKVKWF